MTPKTVNIRPGVSVLAVLRHLNYKPWYALAEFVDNSVESFSRHQAELKGHHGDGAKLVVRVDIDRAITDQITIRDDAAGIAVSEFARAFRPAEIPPDRTGLAEFGMGMKSAACWFAPQWHVRTSALGEAVARTVRFEIENIIEDQIEELSIEEVPEEATNHYTEIVLENVFHAPAGRTLGKLKEHLTDIYRVFIRDGTLALYFNGELLVPKEVPILNAPHYRNMGGPSTLWRKNIEFDFGAGMSVHGFAALREKAKISRAGFSLFRRGRVIQGSGDEGYRPHAIFGSSNSYRYQRLVGELHLDGFDVSHTKDGFRWDENEEPFLELLREHLDSADMPMLKQAENYRVRGPHSQLKRAAKHAVGNTARAIEEQLPAVLPVISDAPPVETPYGAAPVAHPLARRQLQIEFRGEEWRIGIELTKDPAESEWLVVNPTQRSDDEPRSLNIRVSMAHPFMVRFAQTDGEDVEALLRLAAALALAEVLARSAGVRYAGTVRRNFNAIVRQALSDA